MKLGQKKESRTLTLSQPIVLMGEGHVPKKQPPATPEDVGVLPVDILENKNEILIVAPLAGVEIGETEIVISEDLLTIQGVRLMDEGMGQIKGGEYFSQECHWGPFSRSMILPPEADPQGIEASERNHLLYIRIPKRPPVQIRIVRIKSK